MRNRFHLLSIVAVAACLRLQAAEPAPNQLTEEEKQGGWTLLFDGKTNAGWRSFREKTFPKKGWVIENGWLHCLGKDGGDVISDAEFDNFELKWDWKQAKAGNSGVKYFVTEKRGTALGHEYQMIDDELNPDAKLHNGRRVTGSFYDVLKPDQTPGTKPPGEINHSRIVVKGNHVEHWLNGAKVLDYSTDSQATRDAVKESKFQKVAGFGEKIKGHILLQDHHSEVWFQNVKIRTVPAE